MPFSVLSVTIILIFAVLMFIQIRNARERGLNKSLQSLVTVIISLTVAIIVSPSVSRFMVDRLYPTISSLDFYRSLNTSETMDAFLRAAASIVLSSVLYLILFGVVRMIIYFILIMVLPQRDAATPEYEGGHESWAQRNPGSLTVLCGALNAVIITMAITAPIMGTLRITNRALDLVSTISKDSVIDKEDEEILESFNDDIPGNLFYQLGGKYMYSATASADLYGKRVYLVNEVDTLEKTAAILLEILPALEDTSKFTDEEIKKIDEICKNVQKIKLTGGFLADIMSEWSAAWLNGRSYMGVSRPKMTNSVRPVFYELLVVCSETDVYSAKANTVTLLRVLAIIADSGMLEVSDGNMEALMNLLSEGRILDEIDEELAKNPNMYMVRKRLPTIVLGEISNEINNGKYNSEQYTVLLNQLANSVSEVQNTGGTMENKIEQLAGYAKEHMSDFGIEITDYIADIAAESLLAELAVMNGDVTAVDIEDFFSSFLSPSSSSYINSGSSRLGG